MVESEKINRKNSHDKDSEEDSEEDREADHHLERRAGPPFESGCLQRLFGLFLCRHFLTGGQFLSRRIRS